MSSAGHPAPLRIATHPQPANDKRSAEEIRRYRKEQEAQIAQVKVGATDWNGDKITKVFAGNEECVVYEVETSAPSESVRVVVCDREPGKAHGCESNWDRIRSKVDEVKAVLYKARHDTAYRQLIASAIFGAVVVGKLPEAEHELDQLRVRINREYREDFKSRTLYLLGTYLACLAALATGTLLHASAHAEDPIPKALFIIAFATIGGALSVSLRIKELALEREIARAWFVLYGVERGMVALFCGLIMYLMLLGKIVFGFLAQGSPTGDPTAVTMLLVILAGFSEKLVPNILRNLEKEEKRSAP